MSSNTTGTYAFNTTTGRYEYVAPAPTKADLEARLKRFQQGLRDCRRRGQVATVAQQEADIAALKAQISAL